MEFIKKHKTLLIVILFFLLIGVISYFTSIARERMKKQEEGEMMIQHWEDSLTNISIKKELDSFSILNHSEIK